jgi:hypothetical protein
MEIVVFGSLIGCRPDSFGPEIQHQHRSRPKTIVEVIEGPKHGASGLKTLQMKCLTHG